MLSEEKMLKLKKLYDNKNEQKKEDNMLNGLATPVTDAAKRKTKAPIRWEFDEQSGKISFFGIGPIPDYTEHNPPS